MLMQYPWHKDASNCPVCLLCSFKWPLQLTACQGFPPHPSWGIAWLMLCYALQEHFILLRHLWKPDVLFEEGLSFFKSKHFWADVIFIQFSLWNFRGQIFAWQCHIREWERNCCPSVAVNIYTCTEGIYLEGTSDVAKLNISMLGNYCIKLCLQSHSSFELHDLKCGKSLPPTFEVVTNALFLISGIPPVNPWSQTCSHAEPM